MFFLIVVFINEAHKQYSLLDTIFKYVCSFGPPGNTSILKSSKPTTCRLAKPADM